MKKKARTRNKTLFDEEEIALIAPEASQPTQSNQQSRGSNFVFMPTPSIYT